VVIDGIVHIAQGAPVIYVDDVPGEGPGNPPENYTSIQDAIDNASVGDTIIVYNGTYYENVGIYKSITLIGEYKKYPTIHGGGSGDTVRITADYVELYGFKIIRGGTTILEDAGLELYEVDNCKIIDNNISLNYAIGLKVKGSNFNNISNNVIFSNFLKGISLEGSFENFLYNNIVNKNEFGIFLDNANENVVINNNVSNNDNGIICQSSNDNVFTDNILMYNNNLGVFLADSYGDTLINNTMVKDGILIYGFFSVGYTTNHIIDTSNTVDGKPVYYLKNEIGGTVPSGAGQVILANCKNVIVENQELTNGDDGILLVYSSNNIIKENNIFSHNIRGIVLIKSHKNQIINNNASTNENGISILESNLNTIKNNSVFLNNYRGISLHESSNNNITSNIISYNEGYGIDLNFHSSFNNISSNKISMNENRDIDLNQDSSNNIIKNNTINTNHGPSIYILNSHYNQFYHNNVISDSRDQAMDDGDNNHWDNGYPSGGNFWSSYDGMDYFKGPGQNISGNDGIGDSPYIDILGFSNSQDNYPFINPIGELLFLHEGWNLISIPFIQTISDLVTVLESINGSYDSVHLYNTTDTHDHWKSYHIDKPSYMNDLHTLEHTQGFFIHIIKPDGVLFEYSGIKPVINQTIVLYPGWNLVGYPSLTKHNRTIGLNNIEFGRDINNIHWYDANSKAWRQMGSEDSFISGTGYWIHSNVETTWEVPL
jgi:parallel beta-helix repeat protein